MGADRTDGEFSCAVCGEAITEMGYLPAREENGDYDPLPEMAVCDACGFNEVGFSGCAPELNDLVDPGPDDVLLYVRITAGGFDIVSTKS